MMFLILALMFNLAGDLSACANRPLGMSNNEIKDWQISASSTYPSMWDPNCHEKYSRLYMSNGRAWCAKHRSDAEWLQIDLGVAAKITGVIVQGRTGRQEWVTSFMISYSTDAFQWQYITDQYGNQKLFQGNFDDHTIQNNYFDQSINARFIKFHTLQWFKHPSMRVEILGCQECKQLLGMPPYGKLTASSTLPLRNKRSCQPNDGYLLSNKGWCPRKRFVKDHWLELDIGHPTLVTGVVTKGKGDTERNHWVTKYKLSFSNDSVVWNFYKDANHLEAKIFGANADKQMERTHFLNSPFWARFIKFHPIEWHQQIGLRAGVFGCPFTATCLPGYFRVNENSNCIENLAFQKEAWANERKSDSKRSYRNSLKTRSFINLIQEGHPSLAVDGNEDNSLHKCAIMDNYYSERPTLIIDLGRMTTIGGVLLKTWQGKGQDSNFAYRDYMFGLERFSVFVDRKPVVNARTRSSPNLATNSTGVSEPKYHFSQKIHLNSNNLCNFVTRNNYAIFSPQIHLQCLKPLSGRYVYIQADGRSNRWSRIFSAVICEVLVYEL